MAEEVKGFANLMRYCNTLEEYEQKKADGKVTDDVLVIVLEDKLIKFKGQTFDMSGEGSGEGAYVEEIYIGTEEPTDENVKIWINPDENPEGSTNPGASGGNGGKELIRSIAVSLDEDGNMFTTDADKSHNLEIVEEINNIFIGGNIGNIPLILFLGNACTTALEQDEGALATFNAILYPSIDESGNITAYVYKINILMDGDVDFTF